MPPTRGRPPRGGRNTGGGQINQGGQGGTEPGPAPDPNAFDPANPYAPGANPPVSNPVNPADSAADPQGQPAQVEAFGRPRLRPRAGESPRTYQRRVAARDAMNEMQSRRRARLREARDAAESEPAEMARKTPRKALVARLNECATRVTRSAIERDEELSNCQHCGRGRTWPMKCHGGDWCIECEARGIECVRGNKRGFDVIRAKQIRRSEPWRANTDQCRQCKSRGCQCWMPNSMLPGPCNQCQADGLPCDISPLPVRRCGVCHWEHKCIECARNHLRCDGQIPCLVCLRKKIECVGLKPDGSCPDIHMSTYGTGLPPCPPRKAVLQSGVERNWPPPSGRLEIPLDTYQPELPAYYGGNQGSDPPGFAGPAPRDPPGFAGPVPLSDPPGFAGPAPRSPPFFGERNPVSPPPFGGETPPQWVDLPPLERDPAFNPNNIRDSLYNPYDDDKPPCSHCAADIENRNCDQNTPCWECVRRDITDEEHCRTARPCELCFMNEIPCDAGTPCQNCMFLGFGADECRPEGISAQRYFPDFNPDESDNEPYIQMQGAEFEYSCAFCVAHGFQGCNPQDRTCLPCLQHGRTALQCRHEERCSRCIEMDLPCDGKMPCSLCAIADGLTSMMCLGRGDTTMPGDYIDLPQKGADIPMGEAGNYPLPDVFGYQFPQQDGNNPFAPAEAQPPDEFIDPTLFAAVQQQPILPQDQVPRIPPGGLFVPPPHVRTNLLPHYRIRVDIHNTGHFDPTPGVHGSWRAWADEYRCKMTLQNGMPCNVLPTMDCDGGDEHGDHAWQVCGECRRRAEVNTAHLMQEIGEKKNLFCCATCSQAQMGMFNSGMAFVNNETLVDYHCDCDAQMQGWLCYPCKYKVIHAVGNRMLWRRGSN